MNDMTQALQAAGVKLPTNNQRIWQWLKDNGPHTVKDVSSELKIGAATVQAAITVMVQRKMIAKHERWNHLNVRINNNYEALGKTFVLLPPPAKRGAAGRAAAAAKREEKAEPVMQSTPVFDPRMFLASLTLGEMEQVHRFLGRLFK